MESPEKQFYLTLKMEYALNDLICLPFCTPHFYMHFIHLIFFTAPIYGILEVGYKISEGTGMQHECGFERGKRFLVK
jgi:hypothetical protein